MRLASARSVRSSGPLAPGRAARAALSILSAFLSAFLDALSVAAVLVSVCTGILGVYFHVIANADLPMLDNLHHETMAFELVPHAPEPRREAKSESDTSLDGEARPEVDLSRPFSELKQEIIASFTRNYLTRQLDAHDGNFSRAAASSGLDRMYFKRMLKKVTR